MKSEERRVKKQRSAAEGKANSIALLIIKFKVQSSMFKVIIKFNAQSSKFKVIIKFNVQNSKFKVK